MDRSEENSLVEKLVAGDEIAWGSFCREYAGTLLDFVQLRFGVSREKSEEIVQMTFVRCVRSIGTFDPDRGRLFPWLKTVAGNEARSCTRGRAELPMSTVSDEAIRWLADAIDQTPLPDELLATKDTQLLIRECLNELSARHHQVLVRKYVDGWKVARIAAGIGVSEKAVESLLSRARESFKKVLLAKLATRGLEHAEIFQ